MYTSHWRLSLIIRRIIGCGSLRADHLLKMSMNGFSTGLLDRRLSSFLLASVRWSFFEASSLKKSLATPRGMYARSCWWWRLYQTSLGTSWSAPHDSTMSTVNSALPMVYIVSLFGKSGVLILFYRDYIVELIAQWLLSPIELFFSWLCYVIFLNSYFSL